MPKKHRRDFGAGFVLSRFRQKDFKNMANREQVQDTCVLLDIDGTMSDTRAHMQALNERLAEAFPVVGDALPRIRAQRHAFREQYGHLAHDEQDTIWQHHHPDTSLHSQLDVYRSLAPDVFTEEKTAEVYRWLSHPVNFGYAEYEDVQPMIDGLRPLGVAKALFTLGQRTTVDGAPGWQQLKIAASPRLSQFYSHIADSLPGGGKGEIINRSYDAHTDTFRFPMTDKLGSIATKGIVLVDDSEHNMQIAQPGLGILVDRSGKHIAKEYPSNIHIVRSLIEVPDLVGAYMEQR